MCTLKSELNLIYAASISFSMSACKTVSEKEGPTKPFNILWITCKDMSPRLGSYGDPIAKTPNIDNLAREGIRFTRAHSVSGVSAPSRAALITGM